jgi:hypothetical protein
MRGFGEITPDEADQILAEHRKWDAACREADAAHGVAMAMQADDACKARYEAAEQRFIKAPVRTVEDVGLKLRFLADLENYDQARSMAPAKVVYAMIRDINAGKVA